MGRRVETKIERTTSTRFQDVVTRLEDALPIQEALPLAVRKPLHDLAERLFDQYQASNGKAMRQRRRYIWIVRGAAITGTLAVGVGVWELWARNPPQPFTTYAEIFSLSLAVLLVALGMKMAAHPLWLVRRHIAERCQLLFWRLLINARLWKGEVEALSAIDGATAELKKIERLGERETKHWIEAHEDDHELPPPPNHLPPSLIDLYLAVRLGGQRVFFEDRRKRNYRMHHLTKHVGLMALAASMLLTIGHFAYEKFTESGVNVPELKASEPLDVGRLLLLISGLIPVIAAGVRAFPRAHEPARHALRYRAKSDTLKHIRDTIPSVQSSPQEVLKQLAFAETVLESEHREWLRLMMDAEWFG